MVVQYRTKEKWLKIRIQINKTKSMHMNLNRRNNARRMGNYTEHTPTDLLREIYFGIVIATPNIVSSYILSKCPN